MNCTENFELASSNETVPTLAWQQKGSSHYQEDKKNIGNEYQRRMDRRWEEGCMETP